MIFNCPSHPISDQQHINHPNNENKRYKNTFSLSLLLLLLSIINYNIFFIACIEYIILYI